MTDRFEEAVRQAAQGLGEHAPGEIPSYHGAWQRGRRRRMVKQGGIAFAGAVALVAALTLNIGNMPGRGSVEVDVALPVEVATGAPLLPTTAPVFVPTSVPEPEATRPAPPVAAVDPTVTEDLPESPESDAAPSPTAEVPAVAAQTAPAATAVPAAPTPVPAEVVEPEEPTPTPTTVTPPIQRAPTATPVPTGQGAQDTAVAPEGTNADTPGTSTLLSPDALPNVTFIGPNQKPDAVLLESPLGDGWLACDVNQDGEAEATCKLMETYPCSSAADEALGYLAVDLDEDGEFDTCVAVAATACDTNGDGFADTACSIEFLPGPVDSGSDPEESVEDG